jgi:long-subunit fatty acid transport protein
MRSLSFHNHLVLVVALSIGFLLPGKGWGQLFPNLGGQRVGISAFQFLKLGVGARGIGLGETFVAIANDASALYWNPAGLVQFSDNQILVAHTEYVLDIKHEFLGAALHLSPSDAVGFAVTALRAQDQEITTEAQPLGTGQFYSYGDFAVAATYSRKMTDQFSFGLTVRYIEETLDILKMRGTVVDLGTYYWTGIGTSRFAVVVTNFGPDVAPTGQVTVFSGEQVTSFESFSPPTQFKIGFALDPVQSADQRVTASIELQHPNDNAENLHTGVEYCWNNLLSLRAGVRRTIGEPLLARDNTTASDYTLGVGINASAAVTNLRFDYAFAHFNDLGSVHRISLGVSF